MKAKEFHSDRLIYKPLDLSFASKEYLSWLNNTEVNQYLDFGGKYTMERLLDYLSEVEKNEILFWAVTIGVNGKHIGNIKIDPIDWEQKSGEYGIMMGDSTEWRRGYAFEASKAVIDYCFSSQVGLERITLGVFQENTAAVRLYERLGFVTTKKIRGYNHYYKEERDSLRMSLTANQLNE